MTADNWAVCPKCKQDTNKELETKNEKVKQDYGTISQREFFKLLEDIKNLECKLEKEDTSLREDYEIYMQADGKLLIKYSCYCRVCKWHFEHKQSIEAIER